MGGGNCGASWTSDLRPTRRKNSGPGNTGAWERRRSLDIQAPMQRLSAKRQAAAPRIVVWLRLSAEMAMPASAVARSEHAAICGQRSATGR